MMYFTTIFILIIRSISSEDDPEVNNTQIILNEQSNVSVSDTLANTNLDSSASDLCQTIVPIIASDTEYCKENCTKIANDCGTSPEKALCVAKLKNGSLERNLFFKKCKFKQEFQELVDEKLSRLRNKCVLRRSFYRDSWVDPASRSCHCPLDDEEACSEEDLLDSENIMETIQHSFTCPALSYDKFILNDRSIFKVSIANGKVVHCPKNRSQLALRPQDSAHQDQPINFDTSSIEDSELSKFCQHGWEYSCEDVRPLIPESGVSCQQMCNRIDLHCNSFDSELIDCIRNRLTKGEDHALYSSNNCYFPEDNQQLLGPNKCEFVYKEHRDGENKEQCMNLCHFARDYCELNLNRSKNECLNAIFGSKEGSGNYVSDDIRGVVETFNKNCKFNTNVYGGGLVLCKKKKRQCQYSEWSSWASCTESCIDFDNIPTRFRTRRLLSRQGCEALEKGTIEFEICSHLPTCPNRQWKRSELPEPKVVTGIAEPKKAVKKYGLWTARALDQYPELMDSKYNVEEKEERYDTHTIRKAVVVSTSEHKECTCKKGYREVSFASFLRSDRLKEEVKELCKKDRDNQLVFDSGGRFVYYCRLDTVVKEPESLGCDLPGSREFVACRKDKDIFYTLFEDVDFDKLEAMVERILDWLEYAIIRG